jgi:hypothetical protein
MVGLLFVVVSRVAWGGWWASLFVVASFVLLLQHRRTDFLNAALRADYPDQVRAAKFQAMRLADFVQFFEMFAGHGSILPYRM